MSRKTQRYSKEFKAEAVRTVLENQLSISEGHHGRRPTAGQSLFYRCPAPGPGRGYHRHGLYRVMVLSKVM